MRVEFEKEGNAYQYQDPLRSKKYTIFLTEWLYKKIYSVLNCRVQFCLIVSLIAHVHAKVRPLSKKLVASTNNYKTIVIITNSDKDMHNLSLMRGTMSGGLLRWKLEMHMTFENI